MGSPYCYSIVLGGKFGVGKSSLFRRLRSDDFCEEGGEAGAERYTYKTTIDGKAVEVSSPLPFLGRVWCLCA